jgi:hypothetical protein
MAMASTTKATPVTATPVHPYVVHTGPSSALARLPDPRQASRYAEDAVSRKEAAVDG